MKSQWISDKKNLARFESLQMYYSVAGRDIEREIVPLANDQNLAILPWSPLAGGLLSGKFSRENEKPDGARRATLDFPPVDRERAFNVIDVMRPIAADNLVSVAQVALAWLLAQPHVTSVIIGAKNQEQLLDNIGATELRAEPGADQGHHRCLRVAERIPAMDAHAPVGGPAGAGERQPAEICKPKGPLRRSFLVALPPRHLLDAGGGCI